MNEARKVSGKVVELQAAGKWTNKDGKTMYRFDLTVETDQGEENGQISFEGDPQVKIGETHAFKFYPAKGDYPPSVYLDKPKADGGWKGGGGKQWTPDPEKETRKERWAKQIMITRLACLNTATAIIVGDKGKCTPQEVMIVAEHLETWTKRGIDLKKLVEPAQAAPVAAQAPAPAKAPAGQIPDNDDSTPF